MAKQKKIPASKVLPLFGSGVPLCWCGAPAEQTQTMAILLSKLYPTLCRTHWRSEKQLLAESMARADATLVLHYDKAGQRRKEGSCE